jgi:hypothetical protein
MSLEDNIDEDEPPPDSERQYQYEMSFLENNYNESKYKDCLE